MPSIQTLIGKRFETILQELYPELIYVGDDTNIVPDFEHPLFFAEAKVCFDKPDFTVHLKEYQVEGFRELSEQKPVVYIIGFHDFEDSSTRLSGLSAARRKSLLAEEMKISKLYVVDGSVIANIWNRRNYVCKKGHIQDCTLREGHLVQIITNSGIVVHGTRYFARDYYGVSSHSYSFALTEASGNGGLGVGHILALNQQCIADFFHK